MINKVMNLDSFEEQKKKKKKKKKRGWKKFSSPRMELYIIRSVYIRE